jgi:hypothetical protein
MSNVELIYEDEDTAIFNNLSVQAARSLADCELRATMLGYHYDGLVRVGEPPLWTVVLIDSAGSELTFHAETIEGALEVANDRMALLSGLADL